MEEMNIEKTPENSTPEAWDDSRISQEFRTSIAKDLHKRKKDKQKKDKSRHAKFDIQLDRHEAKYVIPKKLVPRIQEFIRPFCETDPHCKGDPPSYRITTLQLDSPSLSLHYAKEHEATNRFKLRARIYDNPGDSPVFMEVKHKYRGVITKARTSVPFDAWSKDLIDSTQTDLTFKNAKEEEGFLTFIRLSREIGARPVILVRYDRSSFFGKFDSYSRVTFDTNLQYQPTSSWTNWGQGRNWYSMDNALVQNKGYHFSGVVLELKTLSDAPQWMIDLVMHFGLERTGHCKYSNALWMESMFCGAPRPPQYAEDLSF